MNVDKSYVKGIRVDENPIYIVQEDGGILAYHKDQKYPIRRYMTVENMWATENFKKFILAWPRVATKILKKPTLKNAIFSVWHEFCRFSEAIVNVSFQQDKMVKPVAELYRILEKNLGGKREQEGNYNGFLGILSILQNDPHYRWPFQDVLMSARKEELIDHPAKETSRLIDIYFQRETRKEYAKIKPILKFVIYTQKWLQRLISETARELDFKKLELDKIDYYHAFLQGNYNYSDLPLEERLRIREGL